MALAEGKEQPAFRWTALDRRSNAAFIFIIVLAYLSAVSYLQRPLSLAEKIFLITASSVFISLGIFGFAYCQRRDRIALTLAYLIVQMMLARSIIFVAANAGFILFIMLPLASQSVILLPRRWWIGFCCLLLLAMAVPAGLRFGLEVGLRAGIFDLAYIAFVVYFTQIAVGEQRARTEVERLAEELGKANLRLREYASQVEELATSAERNRVAREIHDSLGHYLTGINIQLEAARALFDKERERALDGVLKAQMLTQEGLAEVRRSVAALRGSPIESRTLADALAALAEECRTAGIETVFKVDGEPRELPPQNELTLYRAAQEGLTNVRRHARAAHARLALDYRDEKIVRLSIQDDGVGGVEGAGVEESGFGLLGVRERAQLLGGEVRIRTAAGQGFTLELEFPG
ncbi:MAG: sensor histidine kinase [Acidobacteria bacterium]|nr:sensor histidine kinase [Acidobacteriota bacterium]